MVYKNCKCRHLVEDEIFDGVWHNINYCAYKGIDKEDIEGPCHCEDISDDINQCIHYEEQ